MLTQTAPQANAAALRAHLHHITRRWHELGQPCLLELVYLTDEEVAKVYQVSHYKLDDIELAVQDALKFNSHRLNGYATVNPVDGNNRPNAGKRASAEHIIGSFFHWADADDETAANNIRSFVGPKPNFVVVTGTQPCVRPHVYWELEEFTRNMDAWTDIQRDIAGTLKTDPMVVDPPRIMRLAGTVTWPKPSKQAKGYIPEVVGLAIHDEDTRPLVTSPQMARAFAGGARPKAAAEASSMFATNLTPEGKTAKDYADILRRAKTDGEKHGGVRDLTASLAGSGVPRHMAEAIVREACPVWDDGVEALIATAYAKFARDIDFKPNFDHAPAATPTDANPSAPPWVMQTAADFISGFVAPEYIIDGVVQRGRLYTLTAPTGSGKTAVMLLAATNIATGSAFFDREVEIGDVLFMAGENPDDVRARMIGTMEAQGIDPGKCRLHFIAGTFSIRQDMAKIREAAATLPNLIMVVVDTFAAYFDGEDENSNALALDFARVVRQITTFPSKPAVIMPAHPVKNAQRGNLAPKGGSSLVNEVDGNLTLWNDGGIVTLHWQVKFRGPEFEPLTFELARYESDSIKDAKGRLMPTILAKPMLTLRRAEVSSREMSLEDRLLLNIADDPALSLAQRAAGIGVPHKMKVKRMLEKFSDQKLITYLRTNIELTKKGEKAVDIITSGGKFAPEM